MRCVGCPNSTLEPKIHRIPVDEFALCLSNIDVERIHTLRLYNYGEPLLHKQLASIVAEIPKQRWKASIVEISTNAQWVDWNEFEEMMKLEVVTKRLRELRQETDRPSNTRRCATPSKWEKFIEFLERTLPAGPLVARHAALDTVVRTQEDMRRWDSILRPRGWTPSSGAGWRCRMPRRT